MLSKSLTGVLVVMLCLIAGLNAEDVSLMRVPNKGIQPRMQVDPSGKLHLVYYLGEPGNGNLFYVAKSPGEAGWSSPIRVNHYPNAAVSGGTIRGAQMCIGKGNRVHVVWFGSGEVAGHFSDAEKPSAPMLVTRMADDGQSFEKERNLMSWTSALDGGGSITCDDKGRVWVAWHGRGDSDAEGEMGRDMFLSISDDEGKSFTREFRIKEAPRGACGCCGMNMRFMEPDRLHIVYRGIQGKVRPMIDLWSTDGGKSFRYSNFNPWEIEACPMSSVSLMSASDGRLLLGNEQSGHIRLNQHTSGSGRVIPFSNSLGEVPGKHASMALDGEGNVLLSWAEGAGWAKGGFLRWKMLDQDGNVQQTMNVAQSHEIPVWSFPTSAYFNNKWAILY